MIEPRTYGRQAAKSAIALSMLRVATTVQLLGSPDLAGFFFAAFAPSPLLAAALSGGAA